MFIGQAGQNNCLVLACKGDQMGEDIARVDGELRKDQPIKMPMWVSRSDSMRFTAAKATGRWLRCLRR